MSTPPPPKPPITLQQAIAAEIRHNIIGAVIFLTLTFLIVWGSHHGKKEVIDETGATLTLIGDAILFILITLEPFQQLRRRKANPNRPAPPVVSPQGHPWLIGTNAVFGFSGAGLILTLLFSPGTGMLASIVLWSIFLLQFYRLILQLLFFGAKEARSGMRKWKITHWTHQPDQTHPTEHTTNAG
jgi:hypothetical protein